MFERRLCVLCLAFLAAYATAPDCMALEASNVLVLYNTASSDGAQLASYYSQVHPQARLLGINAPLTEQITADDYLAMRTEILDSGALTAGTDCIVTTKGLPLRIYAPSGLGLSRYSSLESELARIDGISSEAQMGYGFPLNLLASNPYYLVDAPFSYANQRVRLTSRLDGFTVSDIEASIGRAQHAFIGVPGSCYVIDNALTNNQGLAPYSRMVSLRDNVLIPGKQTYVYDGTNSMITAAPGAVLGYVTHGTNAGSPADYILNSLAFSPAGGSVFVSYESYNAATFSAAASVSSKQGLLAQWISKGGSAAVGNVAEPSASQLTVTNEDRMFQMLLGGYTWAESAWNATAQLSYVNTVVGDPLMRYRQWVPGDCNLDGVVDISDLGSVAANYGKSGALLSAGDINGDGMVDLSDLGILASHYGMTAAPVAVAAPSAAGAYGSSADEPSIPEPASMSLLILYAIRLVSRRPNMRRRE